MVEILIFMLSLISRRKISLIFARSMSTPRALTFIVVHLRLTMCDCVLFTIRKALLFE